MNTEEISEFKQKLAVEIIARFPMLQGRNGRISEIRKSDFVDGALWAIEQVQIKAREAADKAWDAAEVYYDSIYYDNNAVAKPYLPNKNEYLNTHHPVK